MDYLDLKHFHIGCAIASVTLFFLRGIWMMSDPEMLDKRWVRTLPHVVDTLLLASALTMVFWSGQYPFQQNWLTAKVVALIIYIALGTVALKRGRNKVIRVCAWVIALLVFTYIVSVAVTKHALVFA